MELTLTSTLARQARVTDISGRYDSMVGDNTAARLCIISKLHPQGSIIVSSLLKILPLSKVNVAPTLYTTSCQSNHRKEHDAAASHEDARLGISIRTPHFEEKPARPASQLEQTKAMANITGTPLCCGRVDEQ